MFTEYPRTLELNPNPASVVDVTPVIYGDNQNADLTIWWQCYQQDGIESAYTFGETSEYKWTSVKFTFSDGSTIIHNREIYGYRTIIRVFWQNYLVSHYTTWHK